MNRKWWIIILLLITIIGAWWYFGSAKFKTDVAKLTPTIEVTLVTIKTISENNIRLNSNITLNNPLPVALHIQHLDYEVFVDAERIINASYHKVINIQSRNSSTINLPMEILPKQMERIVKNLETHNRDSADYRLKATFKIDIPIAGERNFNVDIIKRLPAIRIPKGKLERFKVDKLEVKESSFDAILKVENPNVFPLNMYNGKYSILINKDLNMEGTMEDSIQIPAKGSDAITMHLKLKTLKVGRLAWKFLADKRDTPFIFNFQCILNTDNNIFNKSLMTMKMTGTLNDLKTN